MVSGSGAGGAMMFWCTGGVLGRMLCRQEEKREVAWRAGKTHKETGVPRRIKEEADKQRPRASPGNGLGCGRGHRTKGCCPRSGLDGWSRCICISSISGTRIAGAHQGLPGPSHTWVNASEVEQAGPWPGCRGRKPCRAGRPPHAEPHGLHVEPQAGGTIDHWLCMKRGV